MIQTFDFWNRHELPRVWLCNPDGTRIGNLKCAYGIRPTLRFNQMSEITLTVPDHIAEGGDYIYLDVYNQLEAKRLIYVEEVGHFLIHGVNETDDGAKRVKTITAYSIECELSFKKINLVSGTYPLWSTSNPSKSILGIVLGQMPSWSIGNIDGAFLENYRTFEITDSTIYDFLMNTIEQAFECIFTFSSYYNNNGELIKQIHCKTLENAKSNTDIFLSFDTLIENISIDEMSEEICTCLKVYGDSSLDISGVNPLGTPAIYDFSYYLNDKWMSAGLIQAIKNWQKKCNDNLQPYKTALMNIKKANEILYVKSGTSPNKTYTTKVGNNVHSEFTITHNLGTLYPSIGVRDLSTNGWDKPANYLITYLNVNQFRIKFITAKPAGNAAEPIIPGNTMQITVTNTGLIVVKAQAEARLAALRQVHGARIDGNKPLGTIVQDVRAMETLVNNIQAAITAQDNVISSNQTTLNNIHNALAFTNTDNFTAQQLKELDPYIIENTYQNSAFIATDSMTLDQIQEMQEKLLKQGQEILKRVSVPRYTFAIDTANFLFMKEFLPFSQQLQLGCIVNIQATDNLFVTPILLEMAFNYDVPDEFTLTFGNRNRLDDSAFIFADLFSESLGAGVSTSFNQDMWSKFVNSGANQQLNNLLTNAWDAAKNEVINAANQQTVIDGSGIRCRTQLENEAYDGKQLWITGKTIAFTDNNWDSVKLALGYIALPDAQHGGNGGYAYGIAGEVILGQLIAGGALYIGNKNGTFTFNDSGMHATAGDFTFTSGTNRIQFNNNTGFSILGRPNAQSNDWKTLLNVDSSGNLKVTGSGEFSGTIYAQYGMIGGTKNVNTGVWSGGWAITAGAIYNGKTTENDGTKGIFIGINKFAMGAGKINYPNNGGSHFPLELNSDGKLYAGDANLSGTITSKSGNIGGWNIDDKKLYYGKSSNSDNAQGILLSTSLIALGGASVDYGNNQGWHFPIELHSNGKLYANNAVIKGAIYADSGTFGGSLLSYSFLPVEYGCIRVASNYGIPFDISKYDNGWKSLLGVDNQGNLTIAGNVKMNVTTPSNPTFNNKPLITGVANQLGYIEVDCGCATGVTGANKKESYVHFNTTFSNKPAVVANAIIESGTSGTQGVEILAIDTKGFYCHLGGTNGTLSIYWIAVGYSNGVPTNAADPPIDSKRVNKDT